MNKGSLFTVGFSKVSLPPLPNQQLLQSAFSTLPLSNPSRFQKLLDSEALPPAQSNFPSILPWNTDADAADGDNKDFILSQDFFWLVNLLPLISHCIL